MNRRPFPPADLSGGFVPAPELTAWAQSTFIADTALLRNEDHAHLQQAEIGFLWTDDPNVRANRVIFGQCEIMPPMAMGKWQRSRAMMQVNQWFDLCPDFLITISAPAAQAMDDASFMALIEHELYHAAQATDDFGMPKFNRQTGKPVFAIRGHDVEEFVGVVARYGAEATNVLAMVRAANKGPEIAPAMIASACGNCLRLIKS